MKHPIKLMENKIKGLLEEITKHKVSIENRARYQKSEQEEMAKKQEKVLEYQQAIRVLRVAEGPLEVMADEPKATP